MKTILKYSILMFGFMGVAKANGTSGGTFPEVMLEQTEFMELAMALDHFDLELTINDRVSTFRKVDGNQGHLIQLKSLINDQMIEIKEVLPEGEVSNVSTTIHSNVVEMELLGQ